MYLNFYGLKKEPFNITPDPAFLFLSPTHREAMASIVYGVEKRKGFILLTGDVGTGKTSILRSYLEETDKDRIKVIYIYNTNASFWRLLQTIFKELGMEEAGYDTYEVVGRLYRVLMDEYERGRNLVLVIDEAQNMPVKTLENLRMLSNLETSTDKLIQIVMAAPPEFENLLNLDELRQLKQRMAVRAKILPFTKEEA